MSLQVAQSTSSRNFVSQHADYANLPFSWRPNEPNKLEEQCVHFMAFPDKHNGGHMYDMACRHPTAFACQYFK